MLIFEIFTIIVSILAIVLLKKKNKNTLKRYLILIIGVLIFELFTQPLWHNNLSKWAYLYQDVSWVLTLGWATILLLAMAFVDYSFKLPEKKKFFLYVLCAAIIGLFAEAWVLSLGIRSYSPEVQAVLTGITIPLLNIPIKALYYLPVFMSLIIGFTRYFEWCLDKPIKEEKKQLTKKPKKRKSKKK